MAEQQNQQTQEESKPFSDEQLAAIGNIVNQAANHQLKRMLAPAVGEALKTINWKETLAPIVTELAPKPSTTEEDESGKGKGGKGKEAAFEQQFKDLATKLENAEKRADAAERARAEAEQKRLLDSATTAFRNALQPKLRDDLLDVAVSHFGREIKLAEDGTPVMRVKRAPYKGAPEQDEDVPLAEAVPILLAAPSMKPFLPAPGGNTETQTRRNAPTEQRSGARTSTTLPTDPASRTLAELNAAGLSVDDI